MANKNDLEKEIRLLETINRGLRIKNSDLQTENRRLLNEKVKLAREIEAAIQRRTDAIEEKKKAEGELAAVKDKIKTELLELARRKATLDREDKQMREMARILSNESDATRKEKAALDEQGKRLKLKTAELANEAARFAETRNALDSEKAAIAIDRKLIKEANAKLSADREELLKKMSDIEKVKSAAKDLLNKANETSVKADNVILILTTREDNLTNREKQSVARDAENELHKKENAEEAERLSVKERSLEKISAALDAKDRETEVLRLRVEKTIRDKGISEELRKLREDAK